MRGLCFLSLTLLCVSACNAFSSSTQCSPKARPSRVALSVFGRRTGSKPAAPLPKFNTATERWEAPENEDMTGCDTFAMSPVGALLRQGPGPFITRLAKPDDYEQAVLKYQATEGCTRLEAMANMDAYFNNAADWAFQKNAEKNGAPKVDYSILKKGQAAKTVVWALGITPFLTRIAYIMAVTGKSGVTLDDVFNF